jgi:RNA polymerase sigma factor (sigma-70 family)
MLEVFVTKNSGSTDDAWDNFQETMAALFVNVSKSNFQLTSALKTYIYQINRNMWLAELKRQKKRPIRIHDNEDSELAYLDTTNEIIEKELKLKLIENEIFKLGENCQRIIKLYYHLKKSMKEIALEVGYTNSDNAKSQKAKCIKQLKTRLR